MPIELATLALLVWVLAVSIGDWRRHRIPNGLLAVAAVPGLAVFLFRDHGLLDQSFVASGAGLLIAFAVLLPGFLLRSLGGGDLKFAACCGWMLGPERTAAMLLLMAVSLGAVSLTIWLQRRGGNPARRRIVAGPAIAAGFGGSLLFGLLEM